MRLLELIAWFIATGCTLIAIFTFSAMNVLHEKLDNIREIPKTYQAAIAYKDTTCYIYNIEEKPMFVFLCENGEVGVKDANSSDLLLNGH